VSTLTDYRPGDAFPNVGYVRGFLGREVYAEAPPLPPLIGLSGKKRAGKDTFAGGLIARGATRVAFADPLKEAAYGLNPIIGRPAFPGVLAPQSDVRLATYVDALGWERAKENPEVRRTLQEFGVKIREIDPAFWVRAGMMRAASIDGPVVVTDVRFPNEAEAISAAGGVLVRIDRPGLVSTDEHPSETALDDYPFDLVVVNDKSAETLFETARTLAF
jgi:hypothetical protein